MIAREWKCRVPEAHSEVCTYLYETDIKDSSAAPSFLGARIFRLSLVAKIELNLIKTWTILRPPRLLLAMIFSRHACTQKMRFSSLSLTFQCSLIRSLSISFRQSSGGKRVHLFYVRSRPDGHLPDVLFSAPKRSPLNIGVRAL